MNFTQQKQEEARKETREHCEEVYGGILDKEVIDATVEYWSKRTDNLIATTITDTLAEVRRGIEEYKVRENLADDECEDYVIDITDLKDIINKHYSE